MGLDFLDVGRRSPVLDFAQNESVKFLLGNVRVSQGDAGKKGLVLFLRFFHGRLIVLFRPRQFVVARAGQEFARILGLRRGGDGGPRRRFLAERLQGGDGLHFLFLRLLFRRL